MTKNKSKVGEKVNELAVEYALLKGLDNKDFHQKKDVWEVAAAKIAQDAWAEDRYANFSEIIYQNIKSLVKTHFIPKAEVVEKIENLDVINDTMGKSVDNPLMRLEDFKKILLDLIKNNE